MLYVPWLCSFRGGMGTPRVCWDRFGGCPPYTSCGADGGSYHGKSVRFLAGSDALSRSTQGRLPAAGRRGRDLSSTGAPALPTDACCLSAGAGRADGAGHHATGLHSPQGGEGTGTSARRSRTRVLAPERAGHLSLSSASLGTGPSGTLPPPAHSRGR